MPKITINGKEMEVPPGWTIIKAAQQADIPIAHYCWHDGLSVAGVCRMCMVEVEGMPKLQIACNTAVRDGMVIHTESEKAKEAVKWALDFHLINHPLDCPICDQAGECKLQDYYMSYGLYTPEMNQRKVKKNKVLNLGDRVVLDQERCILCSRCVRFTDEVSKTKELGIFNRGDRSVLATFEGRPLNNKYSVNTVDICPVGALTSKDFRFKQRVWFLKDFDTVCNGCSTGCNITVSYNKNGVFRVRPKPNHEINGYWMCDEGRELYKHSNKEYRLEQVVERNDELGGVPVKGKPIAQSVQEIARKLKEDVDQSGADSVALLVTAQYTNEELESLVNLFTDDLKSKNVFYWKNNEADFDSFDKLLIRGDKNPNTKGLMNLLGQKGLKGTWKDLSKNLGSIKTLIVAGPENQAVYPELQGYAESLKQVENVVWLSACKNEVLNDLRWQIPVKSFVEKDGTFVNHKGMEQKIKAGFKVVPGALTLIDFANGIRETIGAGR